MSKAARASTCKYGGVVCLTVHAPVSALCLVHLTLGGMGEARELAEFKELAVSAGAQCVALVTGSRQTPDPHFFIGSGKAREVRDSVDQEQAELVICDHELSPSQERNLESFLKCRVLGRTGLILDIFAQRARSFEGKLQVELAQLRSYGDPLGAWLDPFGAAKGRYWLARSW